MSTTPQPPSAAAQITARMPDMELRLNETLARTIPGVSLAMAIVFVVVAIVFIRFRSGPMPKFMALAAFVSAAILGGFSRYTRKYPVAPEVAHAAASLVAFVVLVNAVAQLELTGDARQTTNLMLLVFAAGALYLNETWFMLTLASVGAMWLSIAIFHDFGQEWMYFGLAFLMTGVLSWMILLVRRHALMRLELARLQGEWALQQIKESESRFRDLSSLTYEGVAISEAGRVLDVNDAMLEIFGAKRNEVIGRPVLDFVAPAYQGFVHQHLADLVEHQYKIVGVRNDGSHCPIEIRGRNVVRNGRTLRVTTIRDLTQELVVERMKDEFVSVMSHELRTPLTSIRGALGLLSNEALVKDSAKRQRMVEVALESTQHLQRLISDMLDLQKLESGQMTLQRKSVGARSVLDRACQEMLAFAQKRGVELKVDAEDAVLSADEDKLTLAISHLVNNAVKFSQAGSVVTIRCNACDPAKISVEDHGRGISPEELPTIFDRFRQADSSTTREIGGTGIGLALVRSIVQQHGGRIWAESMPGEGSTFHFTIPLARGAESV